MRKTVIYEKFQNNLCSIKSVKNDYSGSLFLLDLLRDFSNYTNSVIVHVRRNNYITSAIEKLKETDIKLEINELKIDKNLFEVSFWFNNTNLNDEILRIMRDLWFAFEQPAFCFYMNQGQLENNREEIISKNLSWQQITNKSDVYVVFKGAEEDVIWIGKNNKMEYKLEKYGDIFQLNK